MRSDFVRARAGRAARIGKGIRWARWARGELARGQRVNRGLNPLPGFEWRRSTKARMHAELQMSDTDHRRPAETRWNDRRV